MADHVFICYARADEKFTLTLAKNLKSRGVPVWIDQWNIPPGVDWDMAIDDAVYECAKFLIVLSPQSVQSSEVRGELRVALNEKKEILPLIYQKCRIPRQLMVIQHADFVGSNPDDTDKLGQVLSVLGIQEIDFSTPNVIQEIRSCLRTTKLAFDAQCRRRNELYSAMVKRLQISEMLEYEEFFFKYYPEMNTEEKFQFDHIRAYTEGALHENNRKILGLLKKHPQIISDIPRLDDLKRHLEIWLSKFNLVFSKRPEMCILYTGVEDGVPFPADIDSILDDWIKANSSD